MKNNLKFRLAREIAKELHKSGFCAYFVGGCVRDMLMRKIPKDIDIATDATPPQVNEVFSGRTYPVGAQFGTLVVLKENIPFQVSTFRDKTGRYCLNFFEDMLARDFTINSLFYDPLKKKLIDLLNVQEDICKKMIRTIGEPSSVFRRDPLRLIRAVRLAVTLGFRIEQNTQETIKKMAGEINKVSKERLRDELILIFTSPHPERGLTLLDETTLLKYVLPQVSALKGIKQPEPFHPEGDVFTHTRLMLKQLKKSSLVLAFACLFHDIAKPQTFKLAERIRFNGHDKVGAAMTEEILKQLKFCNKDRQDIVACVKNHMRMMEAPKMRDSTLKRLFARPTFSDELMLHWLDCIASHRDLTVWKFLTRKYKAFKKRPIIPKPLLNGCALIKIGFTPGPIFGKIHKQMQDLQMEGKLKTKAEARKWVCKRFVSLAALKNNSEPS